METRIFETKYGQFESSLTDAQARAVCATLRSNFAQELAGKSKLSWAQLSWLHKLAIEANLPKPTIAIGDGAFDAVVKVLDTASSKLKWPKLRIGGDNGQIVLKPRNGVIYVEDGERTAYNSYRGLEAPVYYGKIENGAIVPAGRGCPDWVVELIREFCADPIGTATAYGRRYGNCCFCGRELTAGESVDRGYGPVCAEKWGLA
jgi:hypothetical protein